MNPHFVTTEKDLGKFLYEHLGVVAGISVRINDLRMTSPKEYVVLCESSRKKAFDAMCSQAEDKGAHGVVGLRYDSTRVTDCVTEIICYGTAVWIGREASRLHHDAQDGGGTELPGTALNSVD